MLHSISANLLRRGGNYLLVFTTDFSELVFVNPKQVSGKVRVSKLVVERTAPRRHDLEVIGKLKVEPGGEQDLFLSQCEAFDIEAITNEFYREYATHFNQLMDELRKSNTGIIDFHDTSFLHAFTQRLLGRLMFLYFLQKKRWLANNPKFFVEEFGNRQRKQNFYRQVVEPLFFEVLNTPIEDRKTSLPKNGKKYLT